MAENTGTGWFRAQYVWYLIPLEGNRVHGNHNKNSWMPCGGPNRAPCMIHWSKGNKAISSVSRKQLTASTTGKREWGFFPEDTEHKEFSLEHLGLSRRNLAHAEGSCSYHHGLSQSFSLIIKFGPNHYVNILNQTHILFNITHAGFFPRILCK